ncbi:MAG: hypothetical protein EOP10_10910 [Proteobacteria bacterium]|nr:MAG: hypothetical protein EOP10_10910 [Pseudomonadota bacterium]
MLKDLKNLIDAWLKDRSTRNLSLLSRQSGVPYPTLRRVYQQENSPTLETVLALLSVVAPGDNALTFLNQHFNSVGSWVSKLVKGLDTQLPSVDVSEELRDRISFAIITLASAQGTTRALIEKKFGEYGAAKLDRLLEMDAIYEKDDRLYFRYENFSVIEPRLILEQIKHTVDLFDMKQIGDHGVVAQLHTEGLNDAGVIQLARRIHEFEEDLQRIFVRERGTNVVMLSYISSFLHKE